MFTLINKKKIIITLTLLVLLVVIIVFKFFASDNQRLTSVTETVRPFIITGFNDQDSVVSGADQVLATHRIAYFLKKSDIKTTNLTGVVREDSISIIESEGSQRLDTIFLVDIPAAKRTYKVIIRNDRGFINTYVVCPSDKELQYGTFKCEDDLYTEGEE